LSLVIAATVFVVRLVAAMHRARVDGRIAARRARQERQPEPAIRTLSIGTCRKKATRMKRNSVAAGRRRDGGRQRRGGEPGRDGDVDVRRAV
jgi:hypothetical protein